MTEHAELNHLEEALYYFITYSGARKTYGWPDRSNPDADKRIHEHLQEEHFGGQFKVGYPDWNEQYKRHAFEYVRFYLRNHPKESIQPLGDLV